MTIPSGEKENQIKCFVYDPHSPGGHGTPTTYTISHDNKIYITDDLKNRIAVYSLEGSYLGQLKNDVLQLSSPFEITVVANGNILILTSNDESLYNLDSKGAIVYKVNHNELSTSIFSRNAIYPYNDYLFYYNYTKRNASIPKVKTWMKQR